MRQRGEYVGAVTARRRRFGFLVGGGAGDARWQKWYTYDGRAEAERQRAKAVATVERARERAKALTWRQTIAAHIEGKREDVAPRTLETLQARLQRFFGPDLDLPARATPARGQELYDLLRERVSVQEHRHCLSRAKALCVWMVQQGHVRESPLQDVVAKGRPRRGKPQLIKDEVRALLAWCLAPAQRDHEGAAATATLLLLGLRASELCGLTVRGLDDGGRILRAHGTKTRESDRVLAVPCPTPADPHIPDLRLVLQRQAARVKARQHSAAVPQLDPPLFGRDRWWVYRQIQECCDAAGVPRICPQGARGTWASLARSIAQAPVAVAAALGQADLRVQDRHYATQAAIAEGAAQTTLRALK